MALINNMNAPRWIQLSFKCYPRFFRIDQKFYLYNLFIPNAAVDCPTLANPMDGAVSMTEGVTGDTVTYTCDAGFQLSGDTMRTCGSDGTWTGSAPMCDRKYSHVILVIHCADLLHT